jgi:hypothetical protein
MRELFEVSELGGPLCIYLIANIFTTPLPLPRDLADTFEKVTLRHWAQLRIMLIIRDECMYVCLNNELCLLILYIYVNISGGKSFCVL